MMRILLILSVLLFNGCSESVEPEKVEGHAPKAFEKNATDAVGVAEGDEKVSPFGKPAH